MLYIILRPIIEPFARFFLRIKVSGKENIPKNGGCIICPNHTSIADVFALTVIRRQIRYMGKEELFKIPVLNVILRALGAFAVKRGKGDMQAIDNACKILNNGGIFGIFPEGTRSKYGKPGKAKTGAALIQMKTKATLIPVSIRYSTGRFRLFCKTYIHIGKPIEYTEPKENETMRKELRRITENLMGEINTLWEMEY